MLLSLRSATTDSDYVLCVDISIYMYTYIYIYIRQNTLELCTAWPKWGHLRMNHVHAYVHMYTDVHMYTLTDLHVNMCTCAGMYMCTYLHICTWIYYFVHILYIYIADIRYRYRLSVVCPKHPDSEELFCVWAWSAEFFEHIWGTSQQSAHMWAFVILGLRSSLALWINGCFVGKVQPGKPAGGLNQQNINLNMD